MKRITRDRRLTPEEAAKYKAIREQVARELPDLIDRHHERMAALVPMSPPGGRPAPPQTIPLVVSGRELWLSISAVGSSEGAVYAFRDVTDEVVELEFCKLGFVDPRIFPT